MRALFGVAAVVVGCSLAAGADGKYESADGRFKVAFPKGAKVTRTDQTAGVVKGSTATAEAGDRTGRLPAPIPVSLSLRGEAEPPATARCLLLLTDDGIGRITLEVS